MNAEFRIDGTVLKTQRLILRSFAESDLEDFYEYARVPGTGEMAGWKHHESIEETRSVLEAFIAHDKTFALCLRETGKVIGSLGVEKYGMEDKLTEFDGLRGRELGFVLSRDYWGLGLMPEAVGAVTEYLFTQRNLDFLTCGYFDFNRQSRRVQEKCYFRPYRKLIMDTQLGTAEPGVLFLLLNPNKQLQLTFSHPETLIWKQ